MPSVLAIVSKAVFEDEARGLGAGDVWATRLYGSHGKLFANLEADGDLYLVSVRAGRLCLVAVLERPKHGANGWLAKVANETPIRDIHALRGSLKFAGGAPLPADVAKLGMSLQTPRVLSEADVALLSGDVAAPKPEVKVVTRKAKAEPAKKAAQPKVAAKPAGLAGVRAAIAEGRSGDALPALLGIWAEAPSAELAALISNISEAARDDVPNIGGKNAEAVAAWKALAKRATDAQKPALLDRLTDCNSGDSAERIDLVAKWLPDPRVEALLVAAIETPPYTALSTKPFYERVFKHAAKIQNPSMLARLEACVAKLPKIVAETMAKWLVAQLAALLPKLQRLTETAPAAIEIAELAGASQKLGSDPELDTLLAAVYADPANDAPRLVYADALSERGDPRGEFITVQMRLGELPELRAREQELLEAHGQQWLGKLAPWVKSSFRFERGFLVEAVVGSGGDKGHERVKEIVGLPIFSTVHTLESPLEVAVDPVMKALRTFRYETGPDDDWRELLERTERPIEALWIALGYRVRDEQEPVLLECAALPKLRSLIVKDRLDREGFLKLAKAPVVKRLTTLGFDFEVRGESRWPQTFKPVWSAAPVERIVITTHHTSSYEQTYTIHRGEAGYTRAELHLELTMNEHRAAQAVGEALFLARELPLQELDVTMRRSTNAEQKQRLEKELAKLKLARLDYH